MSVTMRIYGFYIRTQKVRSDVYQIPLWQIMRLNLITWRTWGNQLLSKRLLDSYIKCQNKEEGKCGKETLLPVLTENVRVRNTSFK